MERTPEDGSYRGPWWTGFVRGRRSERAAITSSQADRPAVVARRDAPAGHNVAAPAGSIEKTTAQPELDLADDPREAAPRSQYADPTIVTGDDFHLALGPMKVKSVHRDEAPDRSYQAGANSLRRDMVAGVLCGVVTSAAAQLTHTSDVATLAVGGGTLLTFASVSFLWNTIRVMGRRLEASPSNCRCGCSHSPDG
jgi:hypothetical protein